MKTLTLEEIEHLCAEHPGWEYVAGELVRTYGFADFVDAMEFVNRVATLAEASGHHPDLDIRYNKVRLALVTHDAGGVSARDSAFVEAMATW